MNTKQTAHTPTPWIYEAEEFPGNTHGALKGADGKWVASIYWHTATPKNENLAFIVCACNVHDDLVVALQSARKWIWVLNKMENHGSFAEIDAALAKAGAA